ncbi:MAG: phosphatase PAP2 family protein [Actinomycetes bacterium]
MTDAAPDAPDQPDNEPENGRIHILRTLYDLDLRIYERLSSPSSPRFDHTIAHLTNAANNSKLSMAMTATLAGVGGHRGRRAALAGISSVALTSAVANLLVKPLAQRPRPRRLASHRNDPVGTHHVTMPSSHSYPSGHTAAAFAFATGVSRIWPSAASVPFGVATAVGYSRVNTGVHFPSDVALGAVLGIGLGVLCGQVVKRRAPAELRILSHTIDIS